MELLCVPRSEYERFMSAAGVAFDTPELENNGVVVAAQADGCYYVDPLAFRLLVDDDPIALEALEHCARTRPGGSPLWRNRPGASRLGKSLPPQPSRSRTDTGF